MSLKTLLITILLVSFGFCDGEAMFGLSWGMSPTKIKSMGIFIEKQSEKNNLSLYSCNSLPKNISISKEYALIFEHDTSLVKIVLVSKTINEDLYGIEGKATFEEMLNLLKQKYTVKDNYLYTGRKIYKESDEFYECLAYEGCGSWISFLNGPNKIISMSLIGISRGTGYIKIAVEADPEFSNACDKSKLISNSKDSNAF